MNGMIRGLSHIAIRTRNILDSLRFYTEILGLKEAFRMFGDDGELATVYIYIAPNQFLELFANGSRPGDTGKDLIGMCHICLETSDIRQAYQAVVERGGPTDSEIKTGKSRCLLFWTHDPDGNQIEIMELTPNSLQAEASGRLSAQ